MCPIEVTPDVPIYISTDLSKLGESDPVTEPVIIKERVFVLPVGETDHHIAEVNGYEHEPGGSITTERLNPGTKKDYITLITSEDPLIETQGLMGVDIDHVRYRAVNPEKKTE